MFELVSALRSGAQSGADVILRPGSGATVSGGWAVVSDGSAENNYWGNDSVFVQFDGTVEGGAAK